uniref:Peptidase S1 domain-containing protein n=1 Tax=Phlebotomus papatasi TaxID=29031 RepID=A0A1B0D2Y2_PHLPP
VLSFSTFSELHPNLRIVGGSEVSIEDVPYQVSVTDSGEHFCGGSVIGRKHIVTAGHCVKYELYRYSSVGERSPCRKRMAIILSVLNPSASLLSPKTKNASITAHRAVPNNITDIVNPLRLYAKIIEKRSVVV